MYEQICCLFVTTGTCTLSILLCDNTLQYGRAQYIGTRHGIFLRSVFLHDTTDEVIQREC